MEVSSERRACLKAGGALLLSRVIATVSGLGALAQARADAASPPHASPRPSKVRGSLPGRQVEVNGVRYHVGEQGSGEKLVLLLHGMPDTSGVWWQQVGPLVGAGYRVIAPDMLGYGETDKPQDPKRYGGERIVADLVALMDALGLQKIDIVGHDWGAVASWELVLTAPERFRRHVALSVGHPDAAMNASSVREAMTNWYMYLNTQEAAPELYAANDGAFLKKILIPTHPDIDEVWSRLKDPEAMRAVVNWDRGNPMASSYLAAIKGEIPPRKCKVPTMGIWSSGDTYLLEAPMKRSAASMAAPWRYERVEGGSHWLQLDRANEVNRLLLAWFQGA